MKTTLSVSLDDVRAAAERIGPWAHRTPVLTSASLDRVLGAQLWFKCENLQRAGAFKFRGAMNAVSRLSAAELERGVATHSSGNHAAALALAAQLRGARSFIVMPRTAREVKKRAVAGYGGQISFCAPTLEARETTLVRVLEETGAVAIHPYNHPDILAGQGTAALELLEDVPDLDTLIAPVGGGGLLSGTAITATELRSGVRVIGAEPAGADDAYRSMQAGRILPSVDPRTIADGLLTSLGELTYPVIRERVESIVTVSEQAIVAAMRLVWERMKIIIEPSSAVPVAALLEKRDQVGGKKIGVILSGGNVDLDDLPWAGVFVVTQRDAGTNAEGFLLRMPKVELHVHLEGTFRPATLLHLAKKNGVTLPADDEPGIRRWFRFPDFERFIEIYVTCSRCLVDPEDFKLLALDFLAEQAVQNVLWSEVHFTISTHLANGRNGEEVHAALVEAIDEGRKRWGVGMALIPDVVRNYDVPRADATLRWAVDHKDQGVVAMGIGGMEKGLTNLPFVSHFAEARASGLHTVAHAGEHGGPESIRSALDHCCAERIDHGIRAIDDPSLVAHLAERGTPLDVCPSSNVALYAVPSLEEHPLPLLRDAGVTLTLNSDDPPFFGTSLTREYLLLHRTWGIPLHELAALSHGALRHAFVPEAQRPELERRFHEELLTLGVDLGRGLEQAAP